MASLHEIATYIPVILASSRVDAIVERRSASLLAIHNVVKLIKDDSRHFRRRHDGRRASLTMILNASCGKEDEDDGWWGERLNQLL